MQRRWTSPVMILSMLCAVFFLTTAYLFVRYTMLKIRVMFAREQIQIITDMMERTQKNPTSDEYANYARNYYPSGSKQVAGSRLDEIVEQYRSVAVNDMERMVEERRQENRDRRQQAIDQNKP